MVLSADDKAIDRDALRLQAAALDADPALGLAFSDFDVIGLALHEAEITVIYSGRPEQLRDALAQQNLELSNDKGQFTLQLAGATAANSP